MPVLLHVMVYYGLGLVEISFMLSLCF